MKASGAYWTLTDQSFKTNGSVNLVGIVPMCTIKGDLKKLNLVTAQTMEEVVGKDLAYNGNYLGLEKMLNAVSYLYVMRINKNAYVANVYDVAAGTDPATTASYATLEDGASLEELAATVAFQMNFAGNDGRHFVKLVPTMTEETYSIPEVAEDKYTFTLNSAISLDAKGVKVGTNSYPIGLYDIDGTLLAVANSAGAVYRVTSGEVGTESIGTATTTSIVIDSDKITFSASTVKIEAYVVVTQLYTFVHATSADGVMFSVKTSVDFSLDENSDVYYEKVSFGDIIPTFVADAINFSLFENYVELANGSNGEMPTASDIDFSEFNKSAANVCVLMGMTNVSLVNAFAQQSERRVRSCLVGAPELATYAAVNDWASSLYSTEFLQLAWISDIEETSVGDVYISPAVNLFLIYAQMIADYGNLNYPPAGYSYGNIAVTKLMDTDFDLFRDELKTNKINYQWIGPRGAVMWEQRTRYADESDLAYANTVFILRDLRAQLLDFAITKTFRYTSPSDLTTFGKGVDDILRGMKDAGFIAAYSLVVPTFAEAQKAGRKLTIRIGVAITQDSEEILFDVVLNNYADVAA